MKLPIRGEFFMRKRDICIIISAIALALILGLNLFLGEAIETGAWGLSYRTEGKPPEGPASSAQLSQYDAVYLGNTAEKVIYLTFDAGYENGCTAKILDALKKHDAPAAFFLVGNYLEKNPDLVRRMVEEGHIVGNHTMHHPDMSKIADRATFEKELLDLEALFTEITGRNMPKYYRPPQGTYSENNLKMAKELGYRTIFWSLAYVDWNNNAQPTPEQAYAKLLPRVHDGAIVLLHSTSQTNAQILDELLTKWEAMGYRFASLEELFA
jgi:peptidoglycan-N-acetylmuramic acid deacetylase